MNQRTIALLFIFLLCLVPFAVSAQGVNTLTYGSNAVGTLSAQSPVSIYSFVGNTGDVVTIQVLGLESGMAPTLSMLTPSQQFLSGSLLNSVESGGSSLLVTHTLPEDGAYTLIVGGTFGQYALLLGSEAPAPTLNVPGSIDVNFTTEGGQENYRIANNSSDPVAVFITSDTEVGPLSIIIDAANRGTLVQFTGIISEVCFAVPGGSGDLDVTLGSTGGLITIDVMVTIEDGLCTGPQASDSEPDTSDAPIPTLTQPPAPVATAEVSSPGQSSSGSSPSAACTVSSSGPVNVRSGPGTGYGVVTTLQLGVQAPVVGQSEAGWLVIQISGIQGFVAQTVVTTSGNCAGLPFIPAPAQQQSQPSTPTPTATATSAQSQPSTPTGTPTSTPPQQQTATATLTQVAPTNTPTHTLTTAPPTATHTPSHTPTAPPTNTPTVPPPIAPPDSNYALNIALDTTASVTDFVSFPDGDTEDFVSYAVNGLNNSVALPGGQAVLTLSFSCFGTGTQFIVFTVDGQTRSCGQTFQRTVNADSRTGGVRITATGGSPTYVQWVVTGSAPRTN